MKNKFLVEKVKCSDRLPEESKEYYLVKLKGIGSIHTLAYSAKHKKFNCYDSFDKVHAEKSEIECEWWADFSALDSEV